MCHQTDKKYFKKKLQELERRINEKGKQFLKELMDEKEKLALTYDKGGKRCGYMKNNMAEIFNILLRGVWSFPIKAISSFTFYNCNKWFIKCLVDAQMVQRHHSNYVVVPNIYLDTKRYEVLEGRGTTFGSEHRRAKWFAVNLSENICTCGCNTPATPALAVVTPDSSLRS
jgi:hypothetical protein